MLLGGGHDPGAQGVIGREFGRQRQCVGIEQHRDNQGEDNQIALHTPFIPTGNPCHGIIKVAFHVGQRLLPGGFQLGFGLLQTAF